MFRKCFLGLILVSNICFSQDKLMMEPTIEKYVMKYVNDGIDRGVNVMPLLMKNVDSIVFKENLRYPYLGRFDSHNKTIQIAPYVEVDTLIIRTTVYHEITHAILWSSEHSCIECTDIMSSSPPPSFSIYANNVLWTEEVDKLFKLIKEKIK